MGQQGSIITFLFLFLMSYKLFLDTKVFLSIGLGGPPQAPLWSLAKIKCVAADITHGAAKILYDVAIFLPGMASILSDVPNILHVQH